MNRALHVLCLNAGSSSYKLALWQLAREETLIGTVSLTGMGSPASRIRVRDGSNRVQADRAASFEDHEAAQRALFESLRAQHWPAPDAVGHRIVHGGPDLSTPVLLDAPLLAKLKALISFAPLHMPAGIAGIEAAHEHFPDSPHVVCFDTAFHRSLPACAKHLPLPRALWELGIHRYGFHGLSCEYVVQALGAETLGRAIIAHLGSGASMTAIRDGRSIDTTMAFTPCSGFMMGTRSGDLDAGVALHLMNTHGYDASALERLVNLESGLLGVSGSSADMQVLLDACAHDARAAQAVEMFSYQLRKQIGAFTAALGGIDTLVFTGGIGEHAAPVRAAACANLEHLGIVLDRVANSQQAAIISAPTSRCRVHVLATDEDLVIARHTRDVIWATSEHGN